MAEAEAGEEGRSNTRLPGGGYSPDGVPTAMVVFGFVVVLTTYAVINQYEAIRFLGARSEWDFKMAVLVASGTYLFRVEAVAGERRVEASGPFVVMR